MTVMDDTALDVAVLERLAADLGDRAFVASLLVRFEGLLERRLHRIVASLRTDDAVSAMDATLSLKSSAATIGARELLDLAVVIEHDVRRGDLARALAELPRLHDAAHRCRRALADYLGRGER
ncbi:Hpt domain-containing protein [Nocardioides ochotonae]|uniref:Hpt domain-containing protein n=1 Tax=Nocardioides ochotonae TaxID=2685869 RepID=UPI00140C37BF|nr:Hpt domain-containing protein [Nocardioides ochotonae]